ncbi:MAG: ABC-type transport auxiliary lipoprotein family protein [Thiobacillus sp.]
MNTRFIVVAVVMLVSGCMNFGEKGSTAAVVNYVLSDIQPAGQPARVQPDAPSLLVMDTAAAGLYDSDQLVFSSSTGTRGQYQYARWTELPGKRFADLMRARLDRQSGWQVSAAEAYVHGDMLLVTQLIDLYHDASSDPGQVRLELRAELVDLKRRVILGRRSFEHKVPLTRFDANGAAQSSNKAVSLTLDELTAWLATFR